jgi:hypothetical protein
MLESELDDEEPTIDDETDTRLEEALRDELEIEERSKSNLSSKCSQVREPKSNLKLGCSQTQNS